ncbi:MAG: hypothetical protein ACJARX_001544 [Psychroserpens sp.]|jgi:hypothetical protein|uniref:hypothetical protein n=1 Tax=Psychroserpens sp. TaxID=2020870 RepID=UPI0039E5BB14
MSSEYDSANDFMYVFAKAAKNQNGEMEQDEPTDIFWIDLKHQKILKYKIKRNKKRVVTPCVINCFAKCIFGKFLRNFLWQVFVY